MAAAGGQKEQSAHICMTNRKGASLKEIITKDHVKSGRSSLYNELRAWPTSSSQRQFAFEGYNYRESADKDLRKTLTGKLGDTHKEKPKPKLDKNGQAPQDRRFYHVSDDILNHYESALRTNMKAR